MYITHSVNFVTKNVPGNNLKVNAKHIAQCCCTVN